LAARAIPIAYAAWASDRIATRSRVVHVEHTSPVAALVNGAALLWAAGPQRPVIDEIVRAFEMTIAAYEPVADSRVVRIEPTDRPSASPIGFQPMRTSPGGAGYGPNPAPGPSSASGTARRSPFAASALTMISTA
jgi:hypothetical protein